jgi:Uma2 family endonuclease
MNWQELCDSPAFKDLPFKVETNRWGNIEMSPASNEHGLYQVLIVEWLIRLAQQGKPLVECSIQTNQGVKVADVAWASYDFFRRNKRQNPYPQAPEVVVEILSPSNSRAEMNQKKRLYFAKGAQEFWLCDKDGKLVFFNAQGQLPESQIIPGFPQQISIDFA